MKLLFSLRLLATLAVATIIPCICLAAEYSNAVLDKNGVIQVPLECAIEADPDCVPRALSKVVTEYSKFAKFRVTGSYHVGGGNGKVTLLYNKTHKTIKLYAVDYNPTSVRNYHYYGITDGLIRQLAQSLSTREGMDSIERKGNYYFDELITYGCKRLEVIDTK